MKSDKIRLESVSTNQHDTPTLNAKALKKLRLQTALFKIMLHYFLDFSKTLKK